MSHRTIDTTKERFVYLLSTSVLRLPACDFGNFLSAEYGAWGYNFSEFAYFMCLL